MVVVVVVLTTAELFKKIKKVNIFGTHCITNISMDMRTFVRHSSRIIGTVLRLNCFSAKIVCAKTFPRSTKHYLSHDQLRAASLIGRNVT